MDNETGIASAEVQQKKRILVLTDWYEPGYKAGGPIRSCVNFAHHMKWGYEIFILTSDRDLGDKEPYAGIQTGHWLKLSEGVHIYYSRTDLLTKRKLKHLIDEVHPSSLYLNSMFSLHFTILPLWLTRMNKISAKIVLSPRGMLKQSALQFKNKRKLLFLSLLKMMGIHHRIHFHATDCQEKEDIQKIFGRKTTIAVISNFPSRVPENWYPIQKEKNKLHILFIGRVHPIKNLHFLLSLLKKLMGDVSLTIVGNEEHLEYVNQCRELIKHLPPNITVNWSKELPHHQLEAVLIKHHIFALPTQGENFGHAIFESMAAGRPVVISDQTPWHFMPEEKAGWDLPLNKPELFCNVFDQVLAMEQEEYDCWSQATWKKAKAYANNANLIKEYQNLFN